MRCVQWHTDAAACLCCRKRFDDLGCPHKAAISASGELVCGAQQLSLTQYQQLCAPGSKAPPLSCIYVECLDMCLKVRRWACLLVVVGVLLLSVPLLPGATASISWWLV
jgi:hypothetical protein